MSGATLADSSINTQLWQANIKPYLQEPLWDSTLSYNAGHYLMVPLHAAFETKNESWKKDFAQQFERFADSGYKDMSRTLLYRIQYIYLASEFLKLAALQHDDSLIPDQLYTIIFEKIHKTWNKDKIWQWQYPESKISSFINMREKVLWKLYTNEIKDTTFYRAILDEELYTMATAANLKQFLSLNKMPPNNVLDDMTQIATEVFNKRVKWNTDGGWLFQPGYWHDHQDFEYAGQDTIQDSLVKITVADIAEDVGHSFRMPLWICSFMEAYYPENNNYKYFKSLKIGLDIQLFNHILIPPDSTRPYYLSHNYMDGRNGIYRYNYNNKPGGFGPYELTYTLPVGWWSFLGSTRTRLLYQTLVDNFPLEEGKVVYYYQRDIHSNPNLLKDIKDFQLKRLICRLAVLLPVE